MKLSCYKKNATVHGPAKGVRVGLCYNLRESPHQQLVPSRATFQSVVPQSPRPLRQEYWLCSDSGSSGTNSWHPTSEIGTCSKTQALYRWTLGPAPAVKSAGP